MDDSRLLGPVLKTWFKQWDWPQSVTEGVARAKGWESGPWASQISICMSGRLTPKPAFFVSLGEFNRVVAERDFAGLTDRRLIDRLRGGQPLTHDDGVPWDAVDFFSCFIGALTPPKGLMKPDRQLTMDDVNHWVSELRHAYRELVLATMHPGGPAAVWQDVARLAMSYGVSPEDMEYVQEIISGLRDGTVDECKRMLLRHENRSVVNALKKLTRDAGGNMERLLALDKWRDEMPKVNGYDFDGLPRYTTT